jgi:hypothetical protein
MATAGWQIAGQIQLRGEYFLVSDLSSWTAIARTFLDDRRVRLETGVRFSVLVSFVCPPGPDVRLYAKNPLPPACPVAMTALWLAGGAN